MRRLLALHCSLASGRAWQGLADALPEVEVIAPDLTGHGAAPDWDEAGDYQDQALAIALDAAGDGTPLDVVGHSFGGTLGLRLLVERPGMVRTLALVEPVMFAAADPDLLTSHWIDMTPFEAALEAGDREAAARHFHREWGGSEKFDALPERAREAMAERIHLIAATEPAIVADVHGTLGRLPADPPPVAIVTREKPTPIVASIADGLAARLTGARIERLGSGHMIPMEEPAGLAALLLGLWAEAEG